MNERQIAKNWEKFCITGSVQDYLAYRQSLSGWYNEMPFATEAETTYADHNRWNYYQREEYR